MSSKKHECCLEYYLHTVLEAAAHTGTGGVGGGGGRDNSEVEEYGEENGSSSESAISEKALFRDIVRHWEI